MKNNDLVTFVKKNNIGTIRENVKLSNYTTYKVGGIANFMIYPKNVDKLVLLIKKLNKENINYKVLGNGSNVIFSDKVYNGVIIKLDNFDYVKIDDTVITAGAGASLVKLSYKALKEGLTGLEFASGIPASVGGAVFMNAGAYKSDMGYIVSEIKVLTPELEIKTLYNKDLNYKYRTSFLKHNPNYICLEATMVLRHGDKKEIKELMETRRQKRLMTQPLNYPSAGSVFRNPDGDFAGRLIEDCGLKGFKIGDAMVSEKHANFIVNKNNATGKDIVHVINKIKDKVYEKYNVELILEQEIVK